MNLEEENKILNEFVTRIIIPKIDPNAIILIGSFLTKLSNNSDIDLVIFLGKSRLDKFKDEIKRLKKIIKLFNLTQETDITFIQDKENPRIESKLIYKSKIFDLTITDSRIYYSKFSQDVSKDNFELCLGNLFSHSKLLFQKGNYYFTLKKKYFPYYNEKLRRFRMRLLKKDIKRLIGQMKKNSINGEIANAIYYLNRTIQSLIQLKFMQKKVYPISYQKWIHYQFKVILKEEKFLNNLNSILKNIKLSKEDLRKLAKILLRFIE